MYYFVINIRSTLSGIRYAKAIVNGINGLILLPDNWDPSINLNNTNIVDADYSSNIIDNDLWDILENKGVVFLPAANSRLNNVISSDSYHGHYWSSTSNPIIGFAGCLMFAADRVQATTSNGRCYGQSVRLVQDVQ